MKRRSIKMAMTSSIFTVLAFVAYTTAYAQDDLNCETKQCRKDLASARAATAKYHDFNAAIADGFVQVSPCVAAPGLGTMGFHFLNFSRYDTNVDPAEPELLLYLPDQDGVMQLVALEYAAIYTGFNPPPVLFGKTMEGPVSHGGPYQYELHAWAWSNNPSGMFFEWNPKLSCPGF